jgi:hypothetical protein
MPGRGGAGLQTLSPGCNATAACPDKQVEDFGDHACVGHMPAPAPGYATQGGNDMNLAAIPRSAMFVGGAILGGAVIGGGIGAVQSLKQDGVDNQLSRQEKRDAIANAIIGAGVGAAAGVALIGARNLVPALGNVPILGTASIPATIGLGLGIGSAGAGAWSLAKHALD